MVRAMTARETDYAVGYKKPPLATRFKPGNTANPRGRPKGSKNLTTLLIEALDRRVVVTEDGRRRKRAKRDLGVARLADKFAEADPQASRLIFATIAELERRPPPEADAQPPFEEADRIVIERLRKRLLGC
jgi:hypothetical protein